MNQSDFEIERAAIAKAQRIRIDQIERLERETRRRLTRHEIIKMELAGVFGQRWANVRRQQGWEARLNQ